MRPEDPVQLVYGPIRFQDASLEVTSRVVARQNRGGIPVGHIVTVSCRGTIFGEGATELSSLSAEVDRGLAIPGADLVLYDDDGNLTATKMLAEGSVGGVIPLQWEYPEGGSGEYVTGRTFSAVFQAEYPLANAGLGTLLDFSETVTVRGNTGARINYQEAINGPQVAIQTTPATLCRATQTGYAIGYLAPPAIPTPLWPTWLQNESPTISATSPRPRGRLLTEYHRAYSYEFVSPVRLSGTPNVWRG
jgi:hypothetical protein